MSRCEEVGHWITEEVLTPTEQFFETARQVCSESRRWVEQEIRRPIETWRTEQEKRCREQECNWFCLCCNKWFCWIVTVLVRVIEWVIEIVGEWVVEIVCKLIVEIVRIVVMVLIHVLKWIVETVVCIIDKFCDTLFLLAALSLLTALLSLVAVGIPALGAMAIPGLIAGAATAALALLLAKVLCEFSLCRLLGVLVWALKWAIVLGAPLAIGMLNAGSAFVVVLLGGTVSALIRILIQRGCPVPGLLDRP